MKRKVGVFLFIGILGTMVACSKTEEIPTEAAPLEPLVVDLTVTESVDIGETVKMEAVVTQGDEKIEDADEVIYEIWEEGKQDEGEKIDSVNEEEGLYTAETSFDREGTYHIQVHVTAIGMHTMPKETVIVGGGGNYEEAEGHDHHETEGFSMHFKGLDTVVAGTEKELVVHLELDAEPFEDASVRYEIWSEGNPDKHDWIDAEELTSGEYSSSYTFKEVDTYTIVIHVEDDEELHEHEEHEINVGK